MKRRAFIGALGALAVRPAWPAGVSYPAVKPGYALAFPRDHGAHPDFRTEWWYATGWLRGKSEVEFGFQVTFFRTRTPYAGDNPSAFAPRQVILAHAALADPRAGRLRHDQRAARAALGVAGADEGTTRLWVDDWRLALEGRRYHARIPARDFALDLAFSTDAPPLLQGVNGYSRKGPREDQASYYYSRPALAVEGSIERGAGSETVTGLAWLDHEWSSEYLASGAAGWDWIGINLEGGGALMAFRMRGKDGSVLYAGGTLRGPGGDREALGPQDVEFTPLRRWRSPRSGTEYPVAMRVRAGSKAWRIEPLFDDQELDSRASTATIYWEGAVRLVPEQGGGAPGRGYLELTGYWKPMRL